MFDKLIIINYKKKKKKKIKTKPGIKILNHNIDTTTGPRGGTQAPTYF